MKNIAIVLLSLILISCAEGQAFIEIEEITADNKLCIVPIRSMISQVGSGEKLLIPKPILIDDPKIIKTIISEWGTEKSQPPTRPRLHRGGNGKQHPPACEAGLHCGVSMCRLSIILGEKENSDRKVPRSS
jgi:hypothetical protein